MDLNSYLSTPGAMSVSQLRARMVELGYDVKSDAQIRQWRIRHNRRVPSPENCVGLELATAKQVSQWRTNGMPKPWKLFFRTKSPKVFRAWELSVGETATASPLGVGHA